MISTTHRTASASNGIKTGDGTGVGFFIPLDATLAAKFPDLGPEDRSVPHVTFLYVGNVSKDREGDLISVANQVFRGWVRGPVTGQLMDMEYFEQPSKDRRVAVMRLRFSHDMAGLRWRLRDALQEAGFVVDDSFPLVYRPHTTLAYLDGLDATFDDPLPQGSWDFDGIEVWGMSKLSTAHFDKPTRTASMVVGRHIDAMKHEVSVGLMKFLSAASTKLGVAKHVYVVGGAVRNFVIGEPIKDIDVVIDSVALGGKDSEWFAKQLQRVIPTHTNLTTNNYGVAILTISGDWQVGGQNLKGEVIEIANARTESYALDTYKPEDVAPATITDDTYRREFTFNTLLWRMHDLADGPDKAEILDLTGCGLRDLQEGVMRCPSDPDKTFGDDPSRMIRAIKFLLKYGFKIAPEVETSIRRNREKIRNIPGGHLSNMLITLFYETGVGKRALIELDKLGILDVIRSIATTDKPFREALANWAERKADVAFLFDLMDLGMPVGKSLGFLNPAQKTRVREITVDMTADEGATFIAVLEQPGKVIDMPALIQEFGLKGAQIRDLMVAARMALLDDPVLVASPRRWESRIRTELTSGVKTASQRIKTAIDQDEQFQVIDFVRGYKQITGVMRGIKNIRRRAKTFTLNPGDPVLFGKWKNKRGLIRDFGVSDKGDPTVTIETPTGRTQVINLFKIREPQTPVPTDGEVPADLAGHMPEYQRLTQEYNVMNRTSEDDLEAQWASFSYQDHLPGGLGDKATPKDFDPKQVAKGKKVEIEHTDDSDTALEIVMDHLTEDPTYYDKLETIEKKAKDLFGPRTPLMDVKDTKVTYRIKASSAGILAAVYSGKTRIGAMDAYPFGNAGRSRCANDILKLLEQHPELEDTSTPRWVDWDNVAQPRIELLSVSRSSITDESLHGLGIGKAMYLAVAAEWFDLKGPFLFMSDACGPVGTTSPAANRVWDSLAKTFPSSGRVIAFLKRPTLPANMRMASKSPGNMGDGRVDKATLNSFMQEYFGATFPNPMDPSARVWSYADDTGENLPLIMTELRPFDGYIHLSAIVSPEKQGTGMATNVLKKITALADKHGVGISLFPKPFGRVPNALSKAGLTSWYKRHGWEVVRGGGGDLLRLPDGGTPRVASKFTDKKEVKKQDGGTMTVYEYSDKHIDKRNKNKAEQVEKLRGSIDKLRTQYRKDLTADDEKTRNTALAVGLMDVTFERVGNDESAKDGHFGVTGWQKKHVTFSGGKATIKYVGKSGVDHVKEVTDAAIVKALKVAVKGKKDNDLVCDGEDCSVGATDVNKYLAPFDVSAKDIRGFHANSEMQDRLKAIRSKGGKLPTDDKEREKKLKDEFKQALAETAEAVGHEPSTLRSQYLVPGLEDDFMDDGKVNKSFVKKASVVDPLESLWGETLVATKTHGEKEDEGAERLVRPAPKNKPPRHDLHQEKVVESDPDLDAKDDDLTLNYKKVAYDILAINKRQQKKNDKKKNPPPPPKPVGPPKPLGPPKPPGASPLPKKEEPEHKPGDVWKTDEGYAANNPDGVTHAFEDKANAEAYAKGKPADEAPAEEGKGKAAPADPKDRLEGLAKALEDGKPKKMEQALKELKTDHPDMADDVDAFMKEYWSTNAAVGKAVQDLGRSTKDKDIAESEAALAKAEKARAEVSNKIRGLGKATKPEEPTQPQPEEPTPPKDEEPTPPKPEVKPVHPKVQKAIDGLMKATDFDQVETIFGGLKDEHPNHAEALDKVKADFIRGAEAWSIANGGDDPAGEEKAMAMANKAMKDLGDLDFEEASKPEDATTPPTKEDDKELDKQWNGEPPKPDDPATPPQAEPEAEQPKDDPAADVDPVQHLQKLLDALSDVDKVDEASVPGLHDALHDVLMDNDDLQDQADALDRTFASIAKALKMYKTLPEGKDKDRAQISYGQAVKGLKKIQTSVVKSIKTKQEEAIAKKPLVIGGVAVSDTEKTSEQLADRAKAALQQFTGASPDEQKTMTKQLKYAIGKAKKGTDRYQELSRIADGFDAASIAKDGKQLEIGDGADKQLMTEQRSPQYLALGKALGKVGKAEILLNINSDDPQAFYGTRGREAIRGAMDEMNDSDLVVFHGSDNGMSQALSNPMISDATKDVLRNFMKNMAIDNMTMCYSTMMASYNGPDNAPSDRQIQDAIESGNVPDATYQLKPLSPSERDKILGKVHRDDQWKILEYMRGQFSFGLVDHQDRILAEVNKLKESDPEANINFDLIGGMNDDEAKAACERARILHLKYLREVMQKSEFKRSASQKMQEFLAHADPKTRERMEGKSPDEFMEIMGALMASGQGDTNPTGKTSGEAELFRQWSSYNWPVRA